MEAGPTPRHLAVGAAAVSVVALASGMLASIFVPSKFLERYTVGEPVGGTKAKLPRGDTAKEADGGVTFEEELDVAAGQPPRGRDIVLRVEAASASV